MIQTSTGLAIQFKHNTDEGVTICHLLNKHGLSVSQGAAYCHELDQFNRKIGRKLSLARALKAAFLCKQNRAEIWAAYFARKGENVNYE